MHWHRTVPRTGPSFSPKANLPGMVDMDGIGFRHQD